MLPCRPVFPLLHSHRVSPDAAALYPGPSRVLPPQAEGGQCMSCYLISVSVHVTSFYHRYKKLPRNEQLQTTRISCLTSCSSDVLRAPPWAKVKVSAGLVPSGVSRGAPESLPFPAPRGCLHFGVMAPSSPQGARSRSAPLMRYHAALPAPPSRLKCPCEHARPTWRLRDALPILESAG